jgi:serine/threonine protein kinase
VKAVQLLSVLSWGEEGRGGEGRGNFYCAFKTIRINRSIINKINSMASSGKEFVIIRFEPSNILLLHKPTKQAYQYFEASSPAEQECSLSHPSLVRPIRYSNGLLYPKEKSSLRTEIENRRRAFSVLPFSEEEIVNTFLPIIECLSFLHGQEVVHGALSSSNIVITDEEDVKLRDWMVEPRENHLYSQRSRAEARKEDDWLALGLILLQAATLAKTSRAHLEKELAPLLEGLVEKYSRGFVFALCVLLKGKKDRYSKLTSYFNNEEAVLNDAELSAAYDAARREREKKKNSVLAS